MLKCAYGHFTEPTGEDFYELKAMQLTVGKSHNDNICNHRT